VNSDQPSRPRGPKLSSAEAQARLADALRDNLKRRKSQLRARDNGRESGAQKTEKPTDGETE
jgi:hypothetical protein